MVIGTTPEHPVIFPIRSQNGKVVDGCKPRRHEPLTVEFPVLIAVGAIPVIRLVVPLVSEAYGDPVSGKCPHFLDKPVVQLPGPLAREEVNDFVSSVNEFRSVSPT